MGKRKNPSKKLPARQRANRVRRELEGIRQQKRQNDIARRQNDDDRIANDASAYLLTQRIAAVTAREQEAQKLSNLTCCVCFKRQGLDRCVCEDGVTTSIFQESGPVFLERCHDDGNSPVEHPTDHPKVHIPTSGLPESSSAPSDQGADHCGTKGQGQSDCGDPSADDKVQLAFRSSVIQDWEDKLRQQEGYLCRRCRNDPNVTRCVCRRSAVPARPFETYNSFMSLLGSSSDGEDADETDGAGYGIEPWTSLGRERWISDSIRKSSSAEASLGIGQRYNIKGSERVNDVSREQSVDAMRREMDRLNRRQHASLGAEGSSARLERALEQRESMLAHREQRVTRQEERQARLYDWAQEFEQTRSFICRRCLPRRDQLPGCICPTPTSTPSSPSGQQWTEQGRRGGHTGSGDGALLASDGGDRTSSTALTAAASPRSGDPVFSMSGLDVVDDEDESDTRPRQVTHPFDNDDGHVHGRNCQSCLARRLIDGTIDAEDENSEVSSGAVPSERAGSSILASGRGDLSGNLFLVSWGEYRLNELNAELQAHVSHLGRHANSHELDVNGSYGRQAGTPLASQEHSHESDGEGSERSSASVQSDWISQVDGIDLSSEDRLDQPVLDEDEGSVGPTLSATSERGAVRSDLYAADDEGFHGFVELREPGTPGATSEASSGVISDIPPPTPNT